MCIDYHFGNAGKNGKVAVTNGSGASADPRTTHPKPLFSRLLLQCVHWHCCYMIPHLFYWWDLRFYSNIATNPTHLFHAQFSCDSLTNKPNGLIIPQLTNGISIHSSFLRTIINSFTKVFPKWSGKKPLEIPHRYQTSPPINWVNPTYTGEGSQSCSRLYGVNAGICMKYWFWHPHKGFQTKWPDEFKWVRDDGEFVWHTLLRIVCEIESGTVPQRRRFAIDASHVAVSSMDSKGHNYLVIQGAEAESQQCH